MDPAPFSAPPPAEVTAEATTLPPPETSTTIPVQSIGRHTISVGPTTVDPSQIPISPQTKSGGTIGTVFIVIGVAIILLGFALSVISISSATELRPEHFQPIIDETVVWNGTGSVNETLNLESGMTYQVRLEHGATVSNFSIWSTAWGKEILEPVECEDSSPDDAIDDCKDYTTVEIGYFEATEDDTISFDSDGDVIICDFEPMVEQVGMILWEYQIEPWAGAFAGVGCGCCLGGILLIVGLIMRYS